MTQGTIGNYTTFNFSGTLATTASTTVQVFYNKNSFISVTVTGSISITTAVYASIFVSYTPDSTYACVVVNASISLTTGYLAFLQGYVDCLKAVKVQIAPILSSTFGGTFCTINSTNSTAVINIAYLTIGGKYYSNVSYSSILFNQTTGISVQVVNVTASFVYRTTSNSALLLHTGTNTAV